ncbi:MAG: type IV secretion system DNA-binding domain-containing protein, partial [Candidatus Riflebacteria bacterium]|nr:type IV secretion system DNA-binding domain-containing protein [Candidatus Riflebacteria bacterium]
MRTRAAVLVVPQSNGGFDALTGFEVRGLGFASGEDAERLNVLQEELLAQLALPLDDRWLELHYVGLPDRDEPWRSRVRLALFAGVRAETALEARARAVKLHEAVCCGLRGTSRLQESDGIVDAKELEALWAPFTIGCRLEMLRRTVPDGACGQDWVLPFRGGTTEFAALPRSLMSAESRARVRLAVRPARLFPWEESELLPLLGLAQAGGGTVPPAWVMPLSGAVELAASLLRSRDQLVSMRLCIDSEGPLPAGVVAALVREVADAGGGGGRPGPTLDGAYELVRLPEAGSLRPLLSGEPTEPSPGAAEEPSRLRRLFTVRQAAKAFRLPILAGPLHGLPCRTSRFLMASPLVPAVGLKLGRNGRRDEARRVAVADQARCRHLYVLGQTGAGKSMFLHSCIMQDLEAGLGVAVIDPHGDLAERVMATMPRSRLDDVVLIDPTDGACPVGVNPLDCKDREEQDRVCEEILTLFWRMWPADFVGPVFQYTVRSLLLIMMRLANQGLIPRPVTLLAFPTFLRNQRLLERTRDVITDPTLAEFIDEWLKDVKSSRSDGSMTYFLSKFDVCLNRMAARGLFGQRTCKLDLGQVIEQGKILLIRLPSGLLGEMTVRFLGFLLMTKIQDSILGRARLAQADRKLFVVYADEFQNFLTDSFPILLAEGRKFGVSLVLANQYLSQLRDTGRMGNRLVDGIFGNVGTILAFRVGNEDAVTVARQFGNDVDPADLVNLPNYQAYARVLEDDGRPRVLSLWTEMHCVKPSLTIAAQCRAASRAKYGTKLAEVQRQIDEEAAAIKKLL